MHFYLVFRDISVPESIGKSLEAHNIEIADNLYLRYFDSSDECPSGLAGLGLELSAAEIITDLNTDLIKDEDDFWKEYVLEVKSRIDILISDGEGFEKVIVYDSDKIEVETTGCSQSCCCNIFYWVAYRKEIDGVYHYFYFPGDFDDEDPVDVGKLERFTPNSGQVFLAYSKENIAKLQGFMTKFEEMEVELEEILEKMRL